MLVNQCRKYSRDRIRRQFKRNIPVAGDVKNFHRGRECASCFLSNEIPRPFPSPSPPIKIIARVSLRVEGNISLPPPSPPLFFFFLNKNYYFRLVEKRKRFHNCIGSIRKLCEKRNEISLPTRSLLEDVIPTSTRTHIPGIRPLNFAPPLVSRLPKSREPTKKRAGEIGDNLATAGDSYVSIFAGEGTGARYKSNVATRNRRRLYFPLSLFFVPTRESVSRRRRRSSKGRKLRALHELLSVLGSKHSEEHFLFDRKRLERKVFPGSVME